jgi:NodT family efflux transporter outer membrane factor (OMF) lipoprotein
MRRSSLTGVAGVMVVLSGCTVGPDYRRPTAPVSAQYKEARPQPGWKLGRPGDAVDRGEWWAIYHDPVLDGLEKRIDISNQNLRSAEAAFRLSEWIVAEARAGFFPTETANASAQRSRSGGGGSNGSGSVSAGGGGGGGNITNFFSTSVSASWTPDLWGLVRRTVEANVATAQASSADLANVRLSAQGTLAGDYLQLRVADELKRLLDTSAADFAESLRITRNQYAAGTAAQSDVSQAEAQLQSTQAQAIAVGVTRAQFEHAIAVLIGVPPAELTIAPSNFVEEVPEIPAGLPSALLERRPDIAAAERTMDAANAEIGVQVAAFYPTITLSADSGAAALMLSRLLSASSRFWSFGASLVDTVFDAGLRDAQVQAARAVFYQDLGTYRETVLTALQQVEDQLAALRILADEAKAQDAAVAAAREAERIINNQYLAGTVAYTSVIVAEQTALADAETALNIRQSRLTASASLVQALGGGWNAAQLPSRGQIDTEAPLDFNPFPPILPVQGQ